MVLCLVFTTAEVTKFTQSNKDFQKVERERKNGTHVKKQKTKQNALQQKWAPRYVNFCLDKLFFSFDWGWVSSSDNQF